MLEIVAESDLPVVKVLWHKASFQGIYVFPMHQNVISEASRVRLLIPRACHVSIAATVLQPGCCASIDQMLVYTLAVLRRLQGSAQQLLEQSTPRIESRICN